MSHSRLVEFGFFYGILLLTGYVFWKIVAPFVTALALASVIVIVFYPIHKKFFQYIARRRPAPAALLSTVTVFTLIITPLFFLSNLLISEFLSLYQNLDQTKFSSLEITKFVETKVQAVMPGFTLDLTEQFGQIIQFVTKNAGVFFSGTLSATMTLLISILASFYLFKDGRNLVEWLVKVSPLPDKEDEKIVNKIALAIRSTVSGTILISIIQGVVATTGFAIFGVPQPVLWGAVGAFGSLLPGIGLSMIMVPAIAYLFFTGTMGATIGLAIWAIVAVIVVDNMLSPYLMSRGNNVHPFLVLLSVLGGVSLFGPIGFILGPVVVSLFLVLIQIYSMYNSEKPVLNSKRGK